MADGSRTGGTGGRAAPRAGRTGPKPPKRVSAAYLERSALHYLERYASSTANLRRVLMRKVQLSTAHHGTDPQEGAAWVEALLERFGRSGLLNDAAYAEMKVAGLHRRGGSTRRIREKLSAKGVGGDQIARALEELEEQTGGSADLTAAIAYARRRRLGPFRSPDRRDALSDPAAARARFDKDLAAMARAGFPLDLARRVLEADDPEGLVEEG